MSALAARSIPAYSCPVPAQSGAGRENPWTLGATAPITGAFFVHGPSSMAGDAGQSVRAGRVPSSRFLTPVSFATLAVRSEVADSSFLTRSLRHV